MGKKRKLLIINVNQFGYSAGHYFYCKYLIDYFDIEYICFDLGRKKINLENVKVKYVSFDRPKIIRHFNFIRTVVKRSQNFRPDVLFVVYFKLSFLLCLFCRANLKILDIRTGSLKKNIIRRYIDNKYLLFQSFFFPKVIVLSENLRKLLGIQLSKTTILPLGAEIFYSGNHNYRVPKLLYVGSLNGRIIYETIESLYIFLNKHPEFNNRVTYTIIGFGNREEELKIKNTILRLGLNSSVSFLGRKTYDELPQYFEEANIGVCYVPQVPYYDIQPSTKIFEYSLSGLITIATETTENKLYISKENGVLCEDNANSFCNAIEAIIQSTENFDSQRIRDSLSYYNWHNLTMKILLPLING
jgi:hypothetical protein